MGLGPELRASGVYHILKNPCRVQGKGDLSLGPVPANLQVALSVVNIGCTQKRKINMSAKSRVPFVGSSYSGLQDIGVCIGLPPSWKLPHGDYKRDSGGSV